MSLTITKITAENILKYEEFSLDTPAKLTLYRGANNQGKTSALKLLSLAFQGASNPRGIIHDGADKGEIVIDFLGFKLRRSFTEKGSYLKLTDSEGRIIPGPQTFLDNLIGEIHFNPLAWLAMPSKEQVRLLLEAIDVRLTPEEFTAATATDAPFGVEFGRHGLLVLDDLRSHFAEERKIENRVADQKKKAAAEIRLALPAERPVITAERCEAAQRALREANASASSIEARRLAAKQHDSAVRNLHEAIEREQRDIRDSEAEVTRLRQLISKNEERQLQAQTRIRQLEVDLADLSTSAPPSHDEASAVSARVAAAEIEVRRIADDERVISRFDDADNVAAEAISASERATKLDETIKAIDTTLRRQLLAKAQLPVGSLAIEDGKIYVDGHELQHIAESQQVRVALAIARALNPKLKVIVLDGTERLDASTFATFLEEIKGDSFQYFASEVDRDGGELQIVRFEAEAAAEEVA